MGISFFSNFQKFKPTSIAEKDKNHDIPSMNEDGIGDSFDIAITGGGLAGLALSIQLNRLGHKVILFEKEHYPFHKVCGEYISNESRDFLKELGLDPASMGVSEISRLQVSSVNGTMISQELPLGGFGISRYILDESLAHIAKKEGVIIAEGVKVNEILFIDEGFIIDTTLNAFRAKCAFGTYGKRSNIDIKWKRPFASATRNKLNNYVAVKYHISCDFDPTTIALHNFHQGYCGIVKIEDNRYCLCYLTTADNLRKSHGSIREMEQRILGQNPHLNKIFQESERLYDTPVTISQISFDKKTQIEDHVLMIGDAAGMITPLCGNGMSMALHGSKIAAQQVTLFLTGKISREKMEQEYRAQWQKQFASRLNMGRRIQRIFNRSSLTNIFISIARRFPPLIRYLIRQTHGKPF
jgi:flavin-dependent dehydrogenase